MAADGYIAKPSGKCCIKGTLHDGEARGVFEMVAGVKTYVSKPPQGSAKGHILLYFPDVWGMFPNGLLVMDGFADAGYLTLGLDYFRGVSSRPLSCAILRADLLTGLEDPVWKHRKDRHDNSDPTFDYEAWKRKHMAFVEAAVPQWVETVKTLYGSSSTKYACVGYCFGAPFVCNELAGETVMAGAFAHPAFLKQEHFSRLENHTFDKASRRHALKILQEGKKTWHLQLFSGVEHGFALRGNPHDPYHRWVKEESLRGIVQWFDFWLSQ